jgi:hypothetical protein
MTTVVPITIQSLMVTSSPASSAATLTRRRSAAYWTLVQAGLSLAQAGLTETGRPLYVG